jgi:hypothetical protein
VRIRRPTGRSTRPLPRVNENRNEQTHITITWGRVYGVLWGTHRGLGVDFPPDATTIPLPTLRHAAEARA